MKDDDALANNPHVSRKDLEALHGQLFGWALTRCGFDAPAAEDLLQETYVAVLSGAARFDNKSALKTFLFGVVQNLARSRFRRVATRMRVLHSAAAELDATSHEMPAEAVDSRRIWLAVQALPARQRDITELVFCRDMTIEEAAAVMGVSVGTGRVHYDRAKKALSSKLSALRDTDQAVKAIVDEPNDER